MSPEQGAASARVDERSDIYSLGCVLYEMLAGEPPFTGPSAESIVRQHLAAAPPRVSAMRAAVPPAIEEAIVRALAKTPADRFATAAEFVEALAAPAQRVRNTGRRTSLLAAGAGLAATLLAAAAGSSYCPGRTAHRPWRPYRQIDCSAAVREREWRPAGGIPERRHQRRAHQRALEAAAAPGRGPAVLVRIQREERGRAADRSGVEGGDRARRERAPGRKPPARDGAADRRPERIQPLVGDLRP